MKKALLFLYAALFSAFACAQEIPVLIKDIVPGTESGFGQFLHNEFEIFVQTEEAFYFYIKEAEVISFWRSNGTSQGTYPLVTFPKSEAFEATIFSPESNIRAAAVGNRVYFVGVDETHGIELWQTDGTIAGTRLAKDLVPGIESSTPNHLFNLDGKLIFAAYFIDESGNRESYLWKSEGTDASTAPFMEAPYFVNEYGRKFSSLEGNAFFSYYQNNDLELWKTDGTAAGTILVKDIATGTASSWPYSFSEIDGLLYFSAETPTYGREPWVSDGTPEGTRLLKDLEVGLSSSSPYNFIKAGENVFFTISNYFSYSGLYRTDGSSEGTVYLEEKDISSLMEFKNQLYFTNYENNQIKTYSATAGTVEVFTEFPSGREPHLFIATDTVLYFSLYEHETGSSNLWRTNGTAAGTFEINNPGGENKISTRFHVFEFKGAIYFVGTDESHGTELWKLAPPSNLISGRVYMDLNKDGLQQNTEPGLANQKILIEPDATEVLTDQEGSFYWGAEAGNYTVTIKPDQEWELSTPNGPSSFNITIPNAPAVSFGLSPAIQQQELSLQLTSSAPNRCSFEVVYWLDYTNTGTLTASGQLKLKPDALVSLVESTPSPTIATDGSLNWSFENLFPSQQRRVMLKFQMPGVDNMGDSLKHYSQAVISGSEMVYSDTLAQLITCSYDPNDKLVKPAGLEEAHLTLKSSWLDYTIRFQNTGTDTAFTVLLRDTLDLNLNLQSFELLGSSHHMQMSRQDRALAFHFKDILLPDSTTNELASHGFVRYRVKAKADIAENTVVENTAYIFFDFNPAIVTNTTYNTLVNKLPARAQWREGEMLRFYPNPGSESITLESPHPFNRIRLFNIQGQNVLYHYWDTTSTQQVLSIKELSAGLYMVEMENEGIKVRKRLVVE